MFTKYSQSNVWRSFKKTETKKKKRRDRTIFISMNDINKISTHSHILTALSVQINTCLRHTHTRGHNRKFQVTNITKITHTLFRQHNKINEEPTHTRNSQQLAPVLIN